MRLKTLVDAIKAPLSPEVDRSVLMQKLRGYLRRAAQPRLGDHEIERLRDERLAKYLRLEYF